MELALPSGNVLSYGENFARNRQEFVRLMSRESTIAVIFRANAGIVAISTLSWSKSLFQGRGVSSQMSLHLQSMLRGRRAVWTMFMLMLAILLPCRAGMPQQFIPGGPVQATVPADVFPQHSKLARQLLMAQEELAAKNYRVGLRRLGLIVGSEPVRSTPDNQPLSEDHFYSATPDDLATFGSLKAAAREMIAGLPAEGLVVYEDLYGRMAQAELQAATTSGNIEKMAEISRRYFHTSAGYEAAYQVAAHHMDHGRPMAAVRIFGELLKQPRATERWEPMLSTKAAICCSRAGRATEAADILAALKQQQSADHILLGGARQPLFPDPATEAGSFAEIFGPAQSTSQQNDDLRVLGGNPARNQLQADSFPFLRPTWQSAVSDNTGVLDILNHWKRALADAEDLSIPAVRPLLVDDLFLVKIIGDEAIPTGSKIRAYDARSGAVRWQTAPDATYDPMPPNPAYNGGPSRGVEDIKRNTVAEQRAWHDHTFADLASDGESVYSVEELDVFRTSNGMVTAPLRVYNLLCAYDLRTGKALWEVGGGPGEIALPLAGTFFLGPPLPLDGRLFVIAEQDRHIRLLVLNPENGELLWSQSLFVVNAGRQSLVLDVWRRVAGLSPAYSQGLIICPTGVGGVVAFDVESRELQWHFTYDNGSGPVRTTQRFAASPSSHRMMPGQEGQRWLNTTPLIAEGRVLIAPQDARQLYCVDVLTGELLWRKQQLDRLQIVGVRDGNVVVLGKHELEVFQLETGKPVFKTPIPIPSPSGRAVLASENVLVPLSTGELVAIDLASGSIVNRAATPDGTVPGNLLCLPDAVVSHGLTAMAVYEDFGRAKLRVAAQLQENPGDLQALLASAVIAQQEGDLAAAIAGFRRVAAASDDLAAQTQLLDLLLQGLQTDFPIYQKHTAEIRALLQIVQPEAAGIPNDAATYVAGTPDQIQQQSDLMAQPDRRGMFLRSLGQGFAAHGNPAAALEAYLEYSSSGHGDWFDEVRPGWGVRRDQWFAARLAELLHSASPEQQTFLNEQADRELVAAVDPIQSERLRRFVVRYGNHPLVKKALRGMVDATADGIRPLETEFALLRLRRDADEQTVALATAKLAALSIDFGRYSDAAGYLQELRSLWAETPILDKKTGQELVESWSTDPLVAERLSDQSPWLEGRVDVDEEKKVQRTRSIAQPVNVLEVRERHSPPLMLQWSMPNGSTTASLTARDGNTKQVWNVEVPSGAGGRINFNSYARACGDLIVLMSGNEILAVDALGWQSGTGVDDAQVSTGQVLWRKYLSGPYPRRGVASRSNNAWGFDPRGRQLGVLGPVTTEGVFYRSGRSIFAVATMTGETLWQRGGVDRNSRLFADEDRLMVVSGDGKTVTYFRMTDGAELGTRDYIPGKQLIAAVDGNVLSLAFIDDQLVIQLQHLWSGDMLWKREFHQRSHYTRVGHDEIAVLSPEGQLTVLNIADGTTVFETEMEYEPKTKSLAVFPADDIYTVIVNHPVPGRRGRTAVPGNSRQLQVNGTVHGIERRTGRLLWSETVVGQAFDRRHPSDIPLLFFANRVVSRVRTGRFTFAVLCLDKRTGKPVYKINSSNGQVLNYEADPEAQTVNLDLGRSLLRFTFTDEPVTTEQNDPAAKPAEEQPALP